MTNCSDSRTTTAAASRSNTGMDSLFRLPTRDIADRLNAMLESERQPCYRRRDYLRSSQPPPPPRSVRTRSPSRSRRGSSISQRSQSRSASRCSAATARTSKCSAASTRHSRQCRSRHSSRSQQQQQKREQQQQPSITPVSRAKIVQWLYDCVDYLELSRECVAVAAGYVDRFMSSSSKVVAEARNDATVYQLVAVSAIFLAAKQDSNFAVGAVDADILTKVSHGSYSVDEILTMENALLGALDWRLCDPTASGMASHLIALLARRQRRSDDRLSSVVDFARLQIELSVADYETSVLHRPSEVALAAVLNSMELLDFTSREEERFAKLLMKETGMDVRSEGIKETRAELHGVFDDQSDVLTGRAAAFSSRTDKSVSTTTSRRTSAASEFATPRSTATRRRRKEEGRRRPRPSPACVGARLDNKPKQLEP